MDNPRRAAAAAISLTVISIDQLSKYLIRHLLTPFQSVHLLPGLTFVRAQNSGISFRLLAHQPDLVIAAVICVIIAVSAYALPRLHTRGFSLAYGLLLGGALSNLFDHVRAHMVSDFIQLPLNFPIFNLADVFVVAGAMIFGWLIMKKALEKDEAVRLANSLP